MPQSYRDDGKVQVLHGDGVQFALDSGRNLQFDRVCIFRLVFLRLLDILVVTMQGLGYQEHIKTDLFVNVFENDYNEDLLKSKVKKL